MVVISGQSLTVEQRRQVARTVVPAGLLILAGFIAARLSPTPTFAAFFDDLHWTIAYSVGAILAWYGVRWSDARNRAARRWFAYGLTAWAVGQLAWNIQEASGWNPYPAPSDAFFLCLGPCVVIGFLCAIRSYQAKPLSIALMLDAGTLAVVVLAIAVAIYLPRTVSEGLGLAVLVAYPISMFAPCCMAAAMIPTLKLRPSQSWLLLVFALIINGFAWMQWIYLAQDDRLESNPWVYLLFSVVPLALGYGALTWDLKSSSDPVWERRCEGFLRMLPLLVVGVAAMSVGIVWALPGLSRTIAVAFYAGSGVVMILASVRQSLLLFERDRLIEMEKRTTELERTCQTLFQITRGGLALLNESGQFLETNPGCARLFGFDRTQLLQMNIKDVCALHQSKLTGALGLLDDHGNGVLETQGIHRNGITVQLELTSALIPDSGGRVFVIFRDITERKRSEQDLRSMAQRLSLATKSAKLGIWELQLRDNKLLWDARMHELYGVDPENFEGRHQDWERRVHPEDRARMEAIAADARAGKREYRAEFRIIRPDGQLRHLETYSMVQSNSEGIAERMIGVNLDITERKHATEKQLELEAQLRQSQKLEAIGTLASGIAHDFNNVLGAILGNIQLALLDTADESPAITSLHEARKAAHRARDLIRRIVAFGRPQDNNPRAMPLQPVIEEAVQLARATLPTTVDISCRFEAPTPAVMIDASQITQVLLNLCTNAYQAMANHKGRINIALDVQALTIDTVARNPELGAGRYVRLQVSDNGHGIDPSIAHRIFEPFFTTKSVGEGSGLGLYVVHNIVRAHGGAIDVDSTPNAGTTVHVYLPVSSAAEPEAPPVAPSAQAKADTAQHIVYVDDEEPLVFLAQRLLERFGYRVSGFTDAAAALAAFVADDTGFDLIITDHSMPGMSGIELAREMLRIRPDTRIVLVSGYLRPRDIEQARAVGIQEVILKPDNVDELAATVHRLLSAPTSDDREETTPAN